MRLRHSGWPVWLVLPFVAGSVLYAGVFSKLVRDWAGNEDYSHGFLILPLAAYFAWRGRDRLARLPWSPSNLGLLVVTSGLAVLAAGVLGAELFLQRVSLLVVIAGLVVFVAGWRRLKALAFPLLFLLLMIPLPAIVFNQVAFPLQLLASQAGEASLRAASIPVLREGNVITLSTTTLQVAEACSGIRSLVSLLTLAVIYGYFTLRRPVSRVLLALASLPVAIAANAARVAGTGFAAHYFGAAAADGFFHTFSGWLVFLLAFVLLWAVRSLIVRALPEEGSADAAAAGPLPTAASGAPGLRLRAVVASALLLFAAAAIGAASQTEPVLARLPLADFPARLGEWRGEPTARFDQQVLTALGVDDYINRIYVGPAGTTVGLYVGYYGSQRQGDTIHSPLNCLPGAGWEPVSRRRLVLPVAAPAGQDEAGRRGPRKVEVNRLLIRKGLENQVVIYWYQGRGRVVASEYWGKAYMVLDAIRLNRTDGALVRIISPVQETGSRGEKNAEAAAAGFAGRILPVLADYLPG